MQDELSFTRECEVAATFLIEAQSLAEPWFEYRRTMETGPDIARIAALIGDRARAAMLMCLMDDKAFTRYFSLADHEVASALEHLISIAHRVGAVKIRTGPADEAARKSRVCYDHLAGRIAVGLFDSFRRQRFTRVTGDSVTLTENGAQYLQSRGTDIATLKQSRRRYACRVSIGVFDGIIWRALLALRSWSIASAVNGLGAKREVEP